MNIYLCLADRFFVILIIHQHGYGSIPINTIFRGMNIHLPAILMFTRGTRFWHTATYQGLDHSHIKTESHHSGSSSKCAECLGCSDSSNLVMLSLKSLNAKKTSPLAQVGLIWSQLLKGAKRGLRFASFRITISCSLKLLRVFRDNDDYSQWI